MLVPIIIIILSSAASLIFSTLTYALRDFSRTKLTDALESAGRSKWLRPTVEHRDDLVFVTAVARLLSNILLFLGMLTLFHGQRRWVQYPASVSLTLLVGLVVSVGVPHALTTYAGETIISLTVELLHGLRIALLPVTKVMHWLDTLVRRMAGGTHEPQAEHIGQDIVDVVEDGVKEGVVDEEEREMIESVIEFRDTQAGQIMTTRPEIVALESRAAIDEVRRLIEDSGHSRVPVYEETLDHIVGILYARDLLKWVGRPPEQFDLKAAVRPAIFIPETKPLRDLLHEFRAQKVHIAIVLDEYGGTAGLVTIEDILEELVGEISDEHEPAEPAKYQRIDERTFEADARLEIGDANRHLGLNIPTDGGFDTLGGFVSITLGRIPAKGTMFSHEGVRYTVLDAEPQRVNRLRIERMPVKVED